jgi:hypothetical protein
MKCASRKCLLGLGWLLFAATGAGCSSGEGAAGKAEVDKLLEGVSATRDFAAEDVSGGPQSPLQYVFRVDSADEKKVAIAVGKAIAACMQKKGFRYFPEFAESLQTTSAPISRRKFAETTGFGLTSMFSVNAAGKVVRISQPGGNASKANSDYLAALSSERQEQYGAALDGQGGCFEAIATKGSGVDSAKVDEKLADARARVDADAVVKGAKSSYVVCMKRQGFEVSSLGAASGLITRELAAAGLVADGSQGDAAAKPVTAASLETLRKKEIEVATADVTCQTDYWKVVWPVQRQIEATILAKNPSLAVTSTVTTLGR